MKPATGSPAVESAARGRLRRSLFAPHMIRVLFLGLVIQVVLLAHFGGIRLVRDTWRTVGLSARVRSERLAFGASFSEYLQFLRERVPDDALVAIPPIEHDPVYGNMGLMQYALFPRRLTNCPAIGEWETCRANYGGENTFVISVRGFPPPDKPPGSKDYVAFDEGRGLFAPTRALPPLRFEEPQVGILGGVGPIAVSLLLGWMTLVAIGGGRNGSSQWYLAYPVGSGILTFGLFVLSWAGVRINLVLAGVVVGVLVVGWAVLLVRRIPRGSPPLSPSFGESSSDTLFPGRTFILVTTWTLALAAIAISVGRSYAGWDSMSIWSVKGYGIGLAGSVFAGGEWGSHGLAYPLNIPLQISIFYILNGDWLPHSKLIFPMYYIGLIAGLYSFLRRWVSPRAAGLVSLLVASAPIVFDHATSGYANLPFSAYLVLGLLGLIEGGLKADRALEAGAGLLLGLSAWTRPEGFYMAIAAGASVWLAFRVSRCGTPSLATWAFPFLVIALPWSVFSTSNGFQGETIAALAVLWASWSHLAFHLADVFRILRYLAWQGSRLEFWGIAFPAMLLAVLVAARGVRFRGNPVQLCVGAAASALFFTVVGYFYIEGFRSDLNYLLSTSIERVAMPGMILGMVWLSTLLPGSQSVERGAANKAGHSPVASKPAVH
jgi:hypothetical protein